MNDTSRTLRMGQWEAPSGIRSRARGVALRTRLVAALELIGRAAPLLGGRGFVSAPRPRPPHA